MRRSLLLLGLLFLACRGSLGPPEDVQGTWAADFGLPGASLVLDINQVDGTIAGTGTYAIEAGRAGTLQVAGTYSRPGITLTIRYDYDRTDSYAGAVLDGRHMTGTLTDGLGHRSELAFTRR